MEDRKFWLLFDVPFMFHLYFIDVFNVFSTGAISELSEYFYELKGARNALKHPVLGIFLFLLKKFSKFCNLLPIYIFCQNEIL